MPLWRLSLEICGAPSEARWHEKSKEGAAKKHQPGAQREVLKEAVRASVHRHLAREVSFERELHIFACVMKATHHGAFADAHGLCHLLVA